VTATDGLSRATFASALDVERSANAASKKVTASPLAMPCCYADARRVGAPDAHRGRAAASSSPSSVRSARPEPGVQRVLEKLWFASVTVTRLRQWRLVASLASIVALHISTRVRPTRPVPDVAVRPVAVAEQPALVG
jgi:hypothetical protein